MEEKVGLDGSRVAPRGHRWPRALRRPASYWELRRFVWAPVAAGPVPPGLLPRAAPLHVGAGGHGRRARYADDAGVDGGEQRRS